MNFRPETKYEMYVQLNFPVFNWDPHPLLMLKFIKAI